jgi:hypothetical protein
MESSETSPILIGQSGAVQGRRWPIPPRGLTFGREEENDIVIDDRQVSRQHARIERRAEGVFLRDLESKNGTFRNGVTIRQEVELEDGDTVQIALAAEFLFIATDSTLPLDLEGATLQPGRIRLNPAAHAVFVEQTQLDPPLSIHQYRLVELLILRGGALVTREELVAAVWPDEEAGGITDQAIDALVRRLRERLREVDPAWEYIRTIRGHGFRINNNP